MGASELLWASCSGGSSGPPSCAGDCPKAIPALGNLLAQGTGSCGSPPHAAAPSAAPAVPLTFPPLCPGTSDCCGTQSRSRLGTGSGSCVWEPQIPQNPRKSVRFKVSLRNSCQVRTTFKLLGLFPHSITFRNHSYPWLQAWEPHAGMSEGAWEQFPAVSLLQLGFVFFQGSCLFVT